jgi:hypothetical protein
MSFHKRTGASQKRHSASHIQLEYSNHTGAQHAPLLLGGGELLRVCPDLLVHGLDPVQRLVLARL